MVEMEEIVGARGLRQGKKPRQESDYFQLASRLSRRAIFQLACPVLSGTTTAAVSSNSAKDKDLATTICPSQNQEDNKADKEGEEGLLPDIR